ncbi:MAG TPA: ATP-binding protein [Elusimicrobia bacterium]|jgi:hypothetical protein|nr:ATP-binding protein [Elusimicrobiota bacterium]
MQFNKTNPFKYGEIVSGEFFTDRLKEKEELFKAIKSGLNVFVYAPRRYGKSSLLLEVLQEAKKQKYICVYLDLLKAPTKQKFFELYARELAKSTTTRIDEALKFCKQVFTRFIPKIVLKPDKSSDLEFEVSWSKETETAISEEVLELPQKIAKQKKCRVVVVFDEFTEITNYNGEKFEGLLRAFIQHHSEVSYIFTGSKRRLLLKMISSSNRPFYKSGKHFPLGKIPEKEFEEFIATRFSTGGIKIKTQVLSYLLKITQNHPYYTQMLGYELYERCSPKKYIEMDDIDRVLNTVLDHQSEYFISVWDTLSGHQKAVLFALSKEPQANIYSRDFIIKHGLSAQTTVQKSISRLIDLEIIEKTDNRYEICDVFFAQWLRKRIA